MIQSFIQGIHHVTATVGNAQKDYDFYANLLGQRLVKRTVNFDNNQVYHFYYGNETGTPGTIMTTFPYEGQGVRQGAIGTGQVIITGFSAPVDAIPFWKKRLESYGVDTSQSFKFGLPTLLFKDPSGLQLEIIGTTKDSRLPWTTPDIPANHAIKGLFNVTLSVAETAPTFNFLTQELGFIQQKTEGKITRFAVNGGGAGQYVDISYDADKDRGQGGIGTVHHVAWRVADDEQLERIRQRIIQLGFKVTEIKDRKYFHSIYFRMPGKVLFEIATIPPGFTADEPSDKLGQQLQLPHWEEPNRDQINQVLPPVNF